jgi:hypothetical protein
MRHVLMLAVGLGSVAGVAQAALPTLNATCPTGIEVHADQGGPVYINGVEAKLSGGDNFYEAVHDGIAIDISINPDGTSTVSYTGPGGANGICQVAN